MTDPDPHLHNVDADMTAYLLLERALCICTDEVHDPRCPFCFGPIGEEPPPAS